MPAPCQALLTRVRTGLVLASVTETDDLVERLEIHYLANRDPHLYFALLTDFVDATAATLPEDKELLDCARSGIERLNRKYPSDQADTFFLFQRPRRWNESEGVWMAAAEKRRGARVRSFGGI